MTTAISSKPSLTVGGSDIDWLTGVLRSAQDVYAVTAIQCSRPVRDLNLAATGDDAGAIVTLTNDDSAMDVRELLDRSPGVRFLFVALTPPPRHAVARVIQETGHAIVGAGQPPLVLTATVAALMARAGSAR